MNLRHLHQLPTWLVAVEVTLFSQIMLVWSEDITTTPPVTSVTSINSTSIPVSAREDQPKPNVSLSARRYNFDHYGQMGGNPQGNTIPKQFGANTPDQNMGGMLWQGHTPGAPGAPGRPGGMGGQGGMEGGIGGQGGMGSQGAIGGGMKHQGGMGGVGGQPGAPGGMHGTLFQMASDNPRSPGNQGATLPLQPPGILSPATGGMSPGIKPPGGKPPGGKPPGEKPPTQQSPGGKPGEVTKKGPPQLDHTERDKIYEFEGMPEAAELINMDVECSLTSMRVRVTFDRPYEGGIYANLYYDHEDCLFVPWGGNEAEYEFELTIDQCGTTFLSTKFGASDSANNLENTLIFQNDPDIQGKWDEARRLQCSWAERMNHSVSHGFQMDVLDIVTVKFSGDNVNADMDIEVGRGPFAPRAEGLIKIGELLTLVIYVYGGNEMDIDIRQCVAHNGNRENSITLSDDRGCIVKKHLMGAWQFTRETGATGATAIAFAFMQAFRFPDTTDVYVECNLEICKGACPDHCPEYPPLDLRFTGKRKRRHVFGPNVSQEATLLRSFRVLADSDVSVIAAQRASHKPYLGRDKICLTVNEFAVALTGLVILLLVTSAASFLFCRRAKHQRAYTFNPQTEEISHIKMPNAKQKRSASLNEDYDKKLEY